MLRLTRVTVLFFGLLVTATPLFAGENGIEKTPKNDDFIGPGYVIGPGDVLDISVWKNDEMTKKVTVLPDGKITFPLIGDHIAEGKTVAQLKNELEAKIIRFIPEPVLSIVVQQVNSMYIYVIGRVNKPGRFDLNTNVNVLQALSMAGGLNPFAKRKKIRIQREENNSTKIYEFNYDDVTKSGKLEQNIRLKRGDVIVVP
jgi:polysaccharide export outer membrane protein